MIDIRGKRVLVMGLGLHGSGIAAARYAAQHGAIVRVTDLRSAQVLAPSIQALAGLPVEYVLGQHRNEDFLWAEIVIRVPGVKRNSPYLQIAREHGAAIELEIALFFQECPGRIIGVTGTRGKTTTTTLIYEILRASGLPAVLGGNVAGVETLSLLPQITPETLVVLELSSWQLEGLAPHAISPSVSVMTNVYPDHLDTYENIEEYAEAKANIFRYQRATDLENILLATTTAQLLGVHDRTIAAAVRNFRGIPHRLEEVRVLNEVRYINDSASTTPVAGRTGLQAFDAPVVLVAGGNTKYLPLEDWPETIVRRCRDVILLRGTGTDELWQAVQEEARKLGKPDPVRGVFENLISAMDTAVALTRPGDVLLFSPGFTSFGMFLNEFDRGDHFIAYVRGMK